MRRVPHVCAALAIALFSAANHAQSPDFHRYDHAANGAPRTIATADFNGDGFPDVALGGTTRDSIGVLLHHGLEDGDEGQRFGPLNEIVVGGGPFEVAAGDLNRDGWPDIAVANADLDAVTILLNDAGRGFHPKIDVAVPGNPRGLAIGDLDRDGIPDIAVTRYQAARTDILYGDGAGGFPRRQSLAAPTIPQGVALADMDANGWVDVIVASVNGTVATYFFRADGVARQDVHPAGGGWNVVTTGDFNRDGRVDAAVASTGASTVRVLTRTPSGGWSIEAPMFVAASPRGIEAGDVNRDGWLDLVVAGRASSMVSVLYRQPAGGFMQETYAAGSGARDVALADFDGNGRLDILTANEFANSTTVLTQPASTETFAFTFEPMDIPDTYSSDVYAVADFNRNGIPDLVRQHYVLLDGTTESRRLERQGTLNEAGAIGDFNRDGQLDVAYTNARALHVFLGGGDGTFSDGPVLSLGGWGWRMRSGDLNRDGIPDLAVVTYYWDTTPGLEVWLGDGTGTFARTEFLPGNFQWLEIADVNRDGILDILVSADGIRVLLGDGSGGWSASQTFGENLPRYGFAVGLVAGDDAIPDLVIADARVETWGTTRGPWITVARGNGDGTFSDHARYDTEDPGLYESNDGLLLVDLDHDGLLDIFTSGGHYLRGNGSGDFSGPERFGVWSFGERVAADVNGDGLVDLAGFSTSTDQPFHLVMLNTLRTPAENRPPAGLIQRDVVRWNYATSWIDDDAEVWGGRISDPDLHAVRYRWMREDGTILSRYDTWWPGREWLPGEYEITFTADDYRGGSVSDTFTFVVEPHQETVLMPGTGAELHGAWQRVADETAAHDFRVWHPNAGAAKRTQALANPSDYFEVEFIADPTQEYKLWVRMKAENDHWGNDSVFAQFTGSADAAGNPVFRIGTTSAMDVNLEECSGCGISGWGWEDNGWGAVDRNGVTVRFPEGGVQTIRIQTREDGVSIDQIVLSSNRFLTARPGTAKNDETILTSGGAH